MASLNHEPKYELPKSKLDLRQLAIDRQSTAQAGFAPTPKWFSRYVVPVGLLLGFAGLIMISAGQQLLPRTSVTVMPVIAKTITASQVGGIGGIGGIGGTPLFQSPGWVEPRPSAIKVTALTSGILEELMVVAGDAVDRGQLLARLNDTDIQLEIEHQHNLIAIRESERARALAEHEAAQQRLANPLHLEAALADARSQFVKAQSQLTQLPFLMASAQAKLKYASQNVESKRQAQGAIPQRSVDLAEQEFATASSEFNELQSRQTNLQLELESLQNKEQILARQLELCVDENQQVKESAAKVSTASALLAEAKIQLKQAELKLSRTQIVAPVKGRILSLVALPGSGLGDSDIHGQTTLLEMYDPQRLQVRADVRLEDVPQLQIGQPVEIKTASVSQTISGRLLQVTSQANIQRNTLEVKVEMIDPPENVKPEMLATVTFLASDAPHAAATLAGESDRTRGATSATLMIPASLIQTDDGGGFVWLVDSNNRAQRQRIEPGKRMDATLREIKSGLQITDKLIVSGGENLKPGSRVNVTGEDQSHGINITE